MFPRRQRFRIFFFAIDVNIIVNDDRFVSQTLCYEHTTSSADMKPMKREILRSAVKRLKFGTKESTFI